MGPQVELVPFYTSGQDKNPDVLVCITGLSQSEKKNTVFLFVFCLFFVCFCFFVFCYFFLAGGLIFVSINLTASFDIYDELTIEYNLSRYYHSN
jgi:hypothetical protein